MRNIIYLSAILAGYSFTGDAAIVILPSEFKENCCGQATDADTTERCKMTEDHLKTKFKDRFPAALANLCRDVEAFSPNEYKENCCPAPENARLAARCELSKKRIELLAAIGRRSESDFNVELCPVTTPPATTLVEPSTPSVTEDAMSLVKFEDVKIFLTECCKKDISEKNQARCDASRAMHSKSESICQRRKSLGF